MIAAEARGWFVFATAPGLDRIYQYRFDKASGKLTPNEPPFIDASSRGAGPRWITHPEHYSPAKAFRHCRKPIGEPISPPVWC